MPPRSWGKVSFVDLCPGAGSPYSRLRGPWPGRERVEEVGSFMKWIKALLIAAVSVGALLVPATTASAVTGTVCAGAVPGGFVKVNDTWDPTRCGNPTSI